MLFAFANQAIITSPACPLDRTSQTLTEFSKNHKGHVARLWAEAQDLVSDLEVVSGQYSKARERYEQSCIQASRYAWCRCSLFWSGKPVVASSEG